MADVVTPNTVMVEMIYTLHGERVENTYHVRTPAAPTSANLASIFAVFDNWERTVNRLGRSNQTSWVAYKLASLEGPGQPVLEASVSPAVVGNAAVTPALGNTTMTIKTLTGLGGRSFRGRIFLVGIGTDNLGADGLWTQAAVDAVVGRFNTLRTSLNTAGFPWVVASKYSGVDADGKAIPRASGITTLVTTIAGDRFIRSRRSRLRRTPI